MSEKLNTVYIGLGSNVGDRLQNLQRALSCIKLLHNTTVKSVSSVYETLPFGKTEQSDFYNAVIKIETGYSPNELLKELKRIEKQKGRIARERWGPREIDLDILLFNELIFSDEIITLPHKGIIYRDFVLFPLIEIEPELINPVYNRRYKDFVDELENKYILKKLSDKLITENINLGCI
ncbi:MAG TPA: 2-amino-4-hydroxy-6-hydroxymethyldihydropteridine diphosphokinase [Ignavibacteriaceae bacterium]|jgi:2-amino-4-hydroxy-6-hydroxymethyldihydropteridine diphosphokinase|nr:MAG: 2-amino-4-hydroxy-6-hydroxymethyldihydropteridine pyrophosphokinase [Ignavibacteria bacterium ADurb.Bin266]OQY74246.1 MAG: 2-amino-4-hydroxy-6-hydroxymethyldihydropteridine diphosphokinase [Ignavibacteriales bacterium UTCHB2]HQF43302.1 2-amino-4-hydroxy-6-hydroxymethyldihydropteridine diphosphokinase [Ignavibacteriaceae bacterium]HQI40024.1 2-amino-4-hydroxy-6-hydroxymethyldihydropteridine diphosphokinase [Ignavibacteriaceae bacterium]HQJ47361.1 2-amino-4-hydroxy-6-hydroxymethyldihydrop